METEQRLGVEILVGRRMLELHLGEIYFQLLGEEHGYRCVRPLPHFDLVHDQGDATRAVDSDEGVGRENGRGLPHQRGQPEAEQQATADRSANSKEGAAGNTALAAHLRAPACLIAARMRG